MSEFEEKDFDRMMSLMSTPGKWPRIYSRVGESNVMDLAGVTSYPDLPAHRKILLLVFLMVVRDRATAIRFEPWRFEKDECENGDQLLGLRMIYEVDGQDLDLVPPPHWLSRHIAREIEALADMDRPRHRVANGLRRLASKIDGQELMPRQGRFCLRLGEVSVFVEVLVYPSEIGERYFLRLSSTSDLASEAATKEMKRLFNVVDDRLCPDLR